MARVIRIGKFDVIVKDGKPTNLFWRFLEQVGTVVTSFADLDGNANDISDGDVNRFRELADLVVTRDGDGRIATVAQNGKTTTITRDSDNRIEEIEEVVDANPTQVTTQTINRDGNDRLGSIDVEVQGF